MAALSEEAQSLQPIVISVVLRAAIQGALRAEKANIVDVCSLNQRLGRTAPFYRSCGTVTSPAGP